MNNYPRIFLVLCLFFASTLLTAQSKQAREVLQSESRRFEAMTRADTAALSPMLADDLTYVHSNALKESKKEHLDAIASKKLVYQKMERENAEVRVYGKTALVNGLVNVGGILQGKTFSMPLLYTAVYRKKSGLWKLLSWQSTRVP